MDKFIVGLTGGIASGKTVISDRLKSRGLTVIDADEISREVTANGGLAEKALKKEFPQAYEGGTLDRTLLRSEVFASEEKLAKLNAITHPLIRKQIFEEIAKSPEKTVVLVVPLLFETGYDAHCDYIVTVVASERTRIKRIINRNNSITDGVAKSMINAQISDSERMAKSHEIIVNDGSLDDLIEKADALYDKIKVIAK